MASSLKNCCLRVPQRWIIALMGFLAFFNAYTLRICLSIAITQMVVPLNVTTSNLVDETCPDYGHPHTSSVNASIKPPARGTFEWSEYTQGIILSSFYWGYVITHIPGGLLAEKYGAKLTMGLGVFLTAVFTIMTPTAIKWGDAPALITLRFLMGLCEGVIQPSMSSLLARWIPPQERSFIGALVYSGVRFGILVSNALSGFIMGRFNNNWPFAFHLFGGIGVLWYLFFVLVVSDGPKTNRFISEGEKRYLAEQLEDHTHEKKPPFPWKHALTSMPFIALVMMQSGSDWCNYTIMSDLPKYMNSVLKLPVEINGYASSIHHVSSWIFCMSVSWISDKLIEKGRTSRTVVRKVNTAIASVGPGVMMISAMYAGCNVIQAVSLITIGLTLQGAAVPGIKVNVLDLSPNYAGTLMGISNGVGAVTGILAPYTVGVLAPNQTLAEWKLIFWIVSGVYFVATLNFIVHASGEVQPWNSPEFLKNEKTKDLEGEARLLQELDRFKVPIAVKDGRQEKNL